MCHGMGCIFEYGPWGDCRKPKDEPCPYTSWEEGREDQEEEPEEETE